MIRRLHLGVLLLLAGHALAPLQAQGPGAGSAAAPVADPARLRHPEEGRPFIRAYAPQEVGAAGQNWAIVQGSRDAGRAEEVA